MKKMKKLMAGITAFMMIGVSSISVSANNESDVTNQIFDDLSITNNVGIVFSVDDGGYYDDAVLLSEVTNNSITKYETTRTYRMPDGTISTDSLTIEKNNNCLSSAMPFADSGQANNITYTKKTGMASVSIIASFDWYTSGSWSYVRCSNMTAYHEVDSFEVKCSRFDKSKSNGYIKAGSAWAKVDYYFYNTKVPVTRDQGSFKVTCSDSGSISS